MAIDEKDSVYLALARQLNTDFLKSENYKSLGKSFDYLVDDFINVIVTEILPERKKIVETGDVKKLQDIAEQVYAAKWTYRLSGGTTEVTLIPLAISHPVDYFGFWKMSAAAKYKKALTAMDNGDRSLFEQGIQAGYFNTEGVFLDRRKKPFAPFAKETAYIASIVAFAKSKDRRWKAIFQDTLGGESDDKIIKLRCCGKESLTKKCPECGNLKDNFQFELIARSCATKFDGVVKTAEKERMVNGVSEKYLDISWVRDEGTIPRARTRITDEDLQEIRNDPLFKQRLVKKSQLEQELVTHLKPDGKLDRTHWIIYEGMVASVNASKQNFGIGKGMYSITLSTKGEGFNLGSKAGVKVHIPDHTWELMGGNRVNQYSSVIVIGHLERELAYDRAARQTIQGEWKEPEIVAWNVIIVDGGKPEQIVADVSEGDYAVDGDPLDDMVIPETRVSSAVTLPVATTTAKATADASAGSNSPAVSTLEELSPQKTDDDGWM